MQNEMSPRGFDRSSFMRPGNSSSGRLTSRQSIVEAQTSSTPRTTSTTTRSSIISFFSSKSKPSTPRLVDESSAGEDLYSCYGEDPSDDKSPRPPTTAEAENMNPKHNNFMGMVIANANTGNKISKPLQSLTMHEVKHLLECLDMHEYVPQFMANDINGSILREMNSIQDFKDCDINLPDPVAKLLLKDLEVLKTKCLSSVFML